MFDFRNGKPLIDRLIPDGLSHAATSFVESLKINSITEKVRRDRRAVVSKRRNVYGERAADLINFYFRGRPSDSLPERRWLPFAICFLRAYNNAVVTRELKNVSSFRPAWP
jgi:hypothetical protein